MSNCLLSSLRVADCCLGAADHLVSRGGVAGMVAGAAYGYFSRKSALVTAAAAVGTGVLLGSAMAIGRVRKDGIRTWFDGDCEITLFRTKDGGLAFQIVDRSPFWKMIRKGSVNRVRYEPIIGITRENIDGMLKVLKEKKEIVLDEKGKPRFWPRLMQGECNGLQVALMWVKEHTFFQGRLYWRVTCKKANRSFNEAVRSENTQQAVWTCFGKDAAKFIEDLSKADPMERITAESIGRFERIESYLDRSYAFREGFRESLADMEVESVEGLQSIQASAEVGLSRVYRARTSLLQTMVSERIFAPRFIVRLQPRSVKSRIDERVLLSRFEWGVTLIGNGGLIEGAHAEIIIEGFELGEYRCYRGSFGGRFCKVGGIIYEGTKPLGRVGKVGVVERKDREGNLQKIDAERGHLVFQDLVEEWKKPKYKGKERPEFSRRSQVYKVPSSKALQLKESIENESEGLSDVPALCLLGRKSLVAGKGADSCYTWAREKMKMVDVEFSDDGFLEMIFTNSMKHTKRPDEFGELGFWEERSAAEV